MKDLTEQWLDEDSEHQEWSETIDQQDQQQQDAEMVVIDLSDKPWPEVLALFNATKAIRSDSNGEIE